ncbi:hypothetical protein LVJ83_06230 [Uruburuella testudinis]|uniref:Uncharacterized protein n=1 Tax=Uruburuella testudinis TaxID=1282863 RepID=A0ABY4DWG8_9NEIS|nr:hypothetical protein [Uruburuella testudinis]UOO83054.1 hypothetical protein LVJ83_06230 [Uruburuella testudinis]
MKNIVLATVLSLTAAAAFANGAPTESYPNGYRPHADLSSVVQEAPRSNIIRAAKNDDSVKLVYTGDRDGAAYSLYPEDNFRARYADIR